MAFAVQPGLETGKIGAYISQDESPCNKEPPGHNLVHHVSSRRGPRAQLHVDTQEPRHLPLQHVAPKVTLASSSLGLDPEDDAGSGGQAWRWCAPLCPHSFGHNSVTRPWLTARKYGLLEHPGGQEVTEMSPYPASRPVTAWPCGL